MRKLITFQSNICRFLYIYQFDDHKTKAKKLESLNYLSEPQLHLTVLLNAHIFPLQFLFKCRPLNTVELNRVKSGGSKMLTRQPDYTISELGHPIHQWSDSTACESLKKLDYTKMPSSPPSPHRLLPLRETLDDCFKRLTMRSREDFEEDPVYQQKLRKNQCNEQQRRR